MKQQVDKIASGWHIRLRNCWVETASWQNRKFMKEQVDETTSIQNVELTKWWVV